MNYYDEIKDKLIDNEIHSHLKDYSKERYRVITYFEIGKLLVEAGGKYGENIIEEYSKRLVIDVGKKFNRRTLYRMKQFYNVFNNEKVSPMVTQLSWSHYLILLSLKNFDEIKYYVYQVNTRKLSKRQLLEIIKNDEYNRLSLDTRNKIINEEEIKIIDLVPNPILVKINYKYEYISEKILKKLILENIDNFLLELGNNFCYVGNEYKIKIGDNYNFIDILLYNIEFNCYVVIELKVTELKKEYIGQIQVYMNYIDNNLKSINQDKTIGIIICKKDNKFILEYSSDKRILCREYKLI